jgi:predicted PurR-regulated permease PerM
MALDSTEIQTTSSGSSYAGASGWAPAPPEDAPTGGPRDPRTVALVVLAVLAVLTAINVAQAVLIPFLLSGLIFYALDPLVDRLQRWHVPRALSAAVLLLALVAGIGSVAYALSGQAMTVVEQLPEGVRRLRAELRPRPSDAGTIDKVQRAAKELDRAAADAIDPAPAPQGVMRVQVVEPTLRASSYLAAGWSGAVAFTAQALLVLFLAYFLLVADDMFKRKLVKHVSPTLGQKKLTVQILDQIGVQIERFLLVQIFTSALVAVVTAVALWSVGLRQAAVWGLAAGVLNSIPYFGPLIVTAGLATVAFLQFGTIEMSVAVAAIALAITTCEGWLLTPVLLGRVGQVNHIAVFGSLLLWSWMWGVWGMFLAIPILMVVKSVADHVEGLQPLADFLGE